MPGVSLPEGLVPSGKPLEFTDADMPQALLREHALGQGHWAMLRVLEGAITFVDLKTNEETAIRTGESVTIHPQEPHRVVVNGPMRCRLEFLAKPNAGQDHSVRR